MKEIFIENPTRIVDARKEGEYVHGLFARIETPAGNFIATWEHRPQAGCVFLASDEGDAGTAIGSADGVCRNPVLIGSLCAFNEKTPDWPFGVEIPVLPEQDAVEYLRKSGIPDDGWETFDIVRSTD